MPPKHFFDKLASSRGFRIALPILLAAVFCIQVLRNPHDLSGEGAILNLAGPGSFLLAGLPGENLAYRMPLFGTVLSAALNLGITPIIFLAFTCLGIYALVFCAGCLLNGYWAGVMAMVATAFSAAGGGFGRDMEQAFYGFSLLLVLVLLLLRRRDNTFKINLLAGLAVGASMLVRTPLFLFSPALISCDVLWGGARSRAFVLRSLVFLAASYALLVPWGVLNRAVTGRFALLDVRNAADNVITAALGSIYTMEGDSLRLAEMGADDSALAFYVRKAAEDPVSYAVTVTRRVWHIFLFFPFLFGLFLAVLLLNKERDLRAVFSLPVYFVFIHSLLSINQRYLYPMVYVLPPLIAGSLLPARFGDSPAVWSFARKAALMAFWSFFCAVLAVEALMIAYPRRSARNAAGTKAFYAVCGRFPGDRALQRAGCGEFWEKGDDARFYGCLGAYSGKFGDRVISYFLTALASGSPPEPEARAGDEDAGDYVTMKCLIIKMLREFELGDHAAAMASFGRAYREYGTKANKLYSTPYRKDNELARLIERDSAGFWDKYVYDLLVLWPPESAVKILSGLERAAGLTPKLRLLDYAAMNAPPLGSADRRALQKNAFLGLALEILGRSLGNSGLLPEKAGRRRPASEAYLRAISLPATAASAGPLLRLHATEEELLRLLELKDAKGVRQKLAASRALKQEYRRHLYGAFCVLFSLQSGSAGSLRESLDSLELGLAADPSALRSLAGLESAAGNGPRARALNSLAEKFRGPADKNRELSKTLSDAAVEKMRAGDYKGGEKTLSEALKLNRNNAEALMSLCALLHRENKKEQALKACLGVSAAVYGDPANRMPGLEMLAVQADSESYKLLIELGRGFEAGELFRRAPDKGAALR